MARSPIEIPIASETRAFRQGIETGVIRPLEDAEDALDKLGRTAAGKDVERELERAQRATKDLKEEVARTAREIEDDFRKSYRRASEHADDSSSRMKDGFSEAGSEAAQSGREAAASFSGEFDDVADFIQETLANGLSGFGPLGAAAGIAVAVGLGAAVQKVTELTERVEDLQERAAEVSLTAIEEGLDIEDYVTSLDAVTDALRRLNEEGQKEFRWFWDEDSTGLEEFNRDLRQIGETQAKATDIFGLGTDQLKRYRDEIEKNSRANQEEEDRLTALAQGGSELTRAEQKRVASLRDVRSAQERVLETLDREIEMRGEATERSTAWADSGAADAQALAEAQEEAAQARVDAEEAAADRIKAAVQSVTQEQLGAYDTMRTAAYEKATADDAAFSIDKWLTYVEESRAAADEYRANLQTMQLTPEEWANLLALPEDARTQIVNSYATSGDEARTRIRQALGDGGAEAGADATVAFNDSFAPKADIEPTVDMTQASADLDKLTEAREVTVKVKLDTSEYDNWNPRTKTGDVRVSVDKAPWNDWRPAQKNGKVYWE